MNEHGSIANTVYLQTTSGPDLAHGPQFAYRPQLVKGQKMFAAQETIGKAWKHMAFWTTATLKIFV